MSNPDQEGYTIDEPSGITVLFNGWDDLKLVMVPGQVVTFKINADYEEAHKADTDSQKANDPMFHGGLLTLFKQTMVMGYAEQVTGSNLDFLSGKLRAQIVQKMKDSGAVSTFTDDQAIAGYSLFLNPVGDFSAQLASRLPSGGYQTNFTGDIVRLKFVTRSNSVKFTASLDFLGQLVDPISVFSGGGPSYTAYFDTVTTVDLQLPHRSSDGVQLIRAITQNANVSVHAENLDGRLLLQVVAAPIANGVYGNQTDLTPKLGPRIQALSGLLAKNRFDQVQFLDNGPLVDMTTTQHPFRDFMLTIDYVQDLLPGSVEPHVEAQVGIPGILTEVPLNRFPYFHGIQPMSRHYANGTRYDIITIRISRQFIHTEVGGNVVELGDHTYIYYTDGTTADLGANFNRSDPGSAKLLDGLLPKHNPPPPGKPGVARVLDLYLDYGLNSIIGRYNGISIFRGTSGQQIRVPGNDIAPTVWFTVTMDGTRTVPIPNLEPAIPPRPGQFAISVAGG